jgi:arginine decarboxylase
VKDAINELAHVYAELKLMGAGLQYIDVGGGLGVDYDGSQTNFHSSVNYSLQEYASDIVSQMGEACNAKGVPHPDIVTESGRALVAHHSVLIFNVLGTNEILLGQIPESLAKDEHRVIQNLYETYASVTRKNFLETYHDALQFKEEAITAFNLGFLDLKARARVEEAGTDPHTQAILFRTTELFLERLGLSTLADLPPLAPLLPDVDSIDDFSDFA